MWVCCFVCGSVIVDNYRFQCFILFLLLLQRKWICSKSTTFANTLPCLHKVFHVSTVCPIDQMTITVEITEAATEGNIRHFWAPGPSDIQTDEPTRGFKVTQKRLLVILAQNEGGVNDP